MSRSFKKIPISTWCNVRAGEMKAWKRLQNRKIRRNRSQEELANGSYYKRLNETYTSPGDGKRWYLNYPKILRK